MRIGPKLTGFIMATAMVIEAAAGSPKVMAQGDPRGLRDRQILGLGNHTVQLCELSNVYGAIERGANLHPGVRYFTASLLSDREPCFWDPEYTYVVELENGESLVVDGTPIWDESGRVVGFIETGNQYWNDVVSVRPVKNEDVEGFSTQPVGQRVANGQLVNMCDLRSVRPDLENAGALNPNSFYYIIPSSVLNDGCYILVPEQIAVTHFDGTVAHLGGLPVYNKEGEIVGWIVGPALNKFMSVGVYESVRLETES